MKEYKIAILGDSISEGLGTKKYNFIHSMDSHLVSKFQNENISIKIKNFARTGTTISYTREIRKDLSNFAPDAILILYGNVEAIIRPNIYKKTVASVILPKRYRKMFMLDPRPFYSHKKWKSALQHLDTFYRWIMRTIISKVNGMYRLMEPNEFYEEYLAFVKYATEISHTVFCVSNVRIDDRCFPKTSKSLEEFRNVIKAVVKESKVEYIPLNEWQEKYEWRTIYGDDHYHPNLNGYNLMGEYFANIVAPFISNNN